MSLSELCLFIIINFWDWVLIYNVFYYFQWLPCTLLTMITWCVGFGASTVIHAVISVLLFLLWKDDICACAKFSSHLQWCLIHCGILKSSQRLSLRRFQQRRGDFTCCGAVCDLQIGSLDPSGRYTVTDLTKRNILYYSRVGEGNWLHAMGLL